MRAIISLAAITASLCASGQAGGADERLASVQRPDSVQRNERRWSGSGGSFGVGQPIAPLSLRVITWEFGDGSLSNILPPRAWTASDAVGVACTPMSLFREEVGGSPCVAACGYVSPEPPGEPRAYVVPGIDRSALVTTGLGTRSLRVGIVAPLRPGRTILTEQEYASGRWALPAVRCNGSADFFMLQDLSTGETWCAGPAL